MQEYQITLSNLPKYLTPEGLQSAVCEILKIPSNNFVTRKRAGSPTATLAITAAGLAAQQILGRLNSERIEGSRVLAVLSADNEDKGHKAASRVYENDKKKRKMRLKAPVKGHSLKDQVTSLWRLPYHEQLEMKQKELQRIVNSAVVEPVVVPLPIASPITSGYRNKFEFTFGLNASKEKTCGLCLGGFIDGYNAVENPEECLHMPAVFGAVVRHTQVLLGKFEGLMPFNVITKEGFWRILLVRIHGDEVMVGLQINETGVGPEVLQSIEDHFKEFSYQSPDHEPKETRITSFQIQQTNVAHCGLDMKIPFRVVFGKRVLEETLGNLKFQISPLSFFQNNIPATLKLYSTIREFAFCPKPESSSADHKPSSGREPVILDLCCGTGTIGMFLSSACPENSKIIGVEMVPEAIADARINAELNGLSSKIGFICEKVENAISGIIQSHPNRPLIVILDPPRAGCHSSVVKAVRQCPQVDRIVFVACDANASVHNLKGLLEEDQFGKFKLTRALPVDLFPHTTHVELVLQFDRV